MKEKKFFVYNDERTIIGRREGRQPYQLTSFIIPDSVKRIDSGCFVDCYNLISIGLPKGLQSVGARAFSECKSLKEIEIPDEVEEIGERCFGNCSGLSSIKLSKKLKILSYEAFSGCESLKEIEIPDEVEIIDCSCFYHCYNLLSIKLPKKLRILGDDAFSRCDSLKEIEIPDEVEEIHNNCFGDCYSLTSVKFPKKLKTMGNYVFLRCYSLKEIEIPDEVEIIGDYCFNDCCDLLSIKLPKKLRILGDAVFAGCNSLEEIEIPDDVEIIGDRCFEDTGLISIKLPKKLRLLGNKVFKGCRSLEAVVIPDDVEIIGESLFDECTSLVNIKLPKNLKFLGNGAFRGCSSLSRLVIPDDVETIGDECFEKSGLVSIRLSRNLKKLGKAVFYRCNSLKRVELFDGIKEIDFEVFKDCENLEEIICFYASYDSLLSFINHNGKFFMEISLRSNKSINLVLSGIELNSFQKLYLKMLLGAFGITKIQFVEKNLSEEDEREDILENNVHSKVDFGIEDEEIKKVLDEIVSLCDKLSESSRDLIINKLYSLVDKYKSEYEKSKPKFRADNGSLEFKVGVEFLKPRLLSELEMIKNDLYREEEVIKYISELDKYKKIVDSDVQKLDENDKSIEGIIKNIVFYCLCMNESKRKKYLFELDKLIQDESMKIADNFDSLIGFEKRLSLEDSLKSKKQFHVSVSCLLDEVSAYASKIKPFKELYDILNSSNDVKEYKDGEDIGSLINGIRYVLNRLSDGEGKKELGGKFSLVIDKYKKIIEEFYDDEDKLKNTSYEELEKNIRCDLHPLLDSIDKHAYIDQYEVNKTNNMNLLEQLRISLNVINNDKEIDVDDEYKYQPITSSVLDVINFIYGNKCFDKETRDKIIVSLLDIINKYIQRLEKDKVDDMEEYNDVLRKIVKEIIALYVDAQIYASSIQNYNKHGI